MENILSDYRWKKVVNEFIEKYNWQKSITSNAISIESSKILKYQTFSMTRKLFLLFAANAVMRCLNL